MLINYTQFKNIKNFFNNINFITNNKLVSTLLLLVGATFLIKKLTQKKKLNLRDKFIVVTGASSGIGLEISKELAKKGCKVILVARSLDKLKETVENFKTDYNNYQCYYIGADLSKEQDIIYCNNEIQSILSNDNNNQYVYGLINCCGAGTWKFLEETSFTECNQMMALPYFAAFNITKLLLNNMILNGDGVVVNINSPVSLNPWGGCIGYACSRWAFRGFTECLRIDLKGTGVNVLEVIPGETKSEYFENNGIDDDSFPLISKYIPKVTVNQVAVGTINSIENRDTKLVIPFSLLVAGYLNFFPFSNIVNYTLRTNKSNTRLNNIKALQAQYKLKSNMVESNNNNNVR